jgi:acetyl-CoA carboxylase biotin carboxyl carrier protein
MKLDIIAQLVQILKDAPDVGAIEIRRGWFGAWSTVRVSKAGHVAGNAGGHVVVTQAGAAGQAAPLPAAAAAAPAPAPSHLLGIPSPMVGTFYSAPEPGAEAYVRVGSRVNVGQVVCIIEAMKIMNEIESEVAGVVKEVNVQNAQPVEFGQVLYRVDPNG